LKGGLHLDALAYCVLWAGLAVLGWHLIGWPAGVALSAGLLLVMMPASALTLSRTGSFVAERWVRWGLLAAAACALGVAVVLRG
jgi:hypothetical protein